MIYYNPQHAGHFERTGDFDLIDSGLGLQGRYHIYRWASHDTADAPPTAGAGLDDLAA